MAFLSSGDHQKEDPLSVTAPEAAAYEFQSGGVVEMLEKLDDKFKGELHELEKKMIVSGQEFTMQIQELINQIEQASDESSLKAKDFENRQMLRKDELVAINKAIEIMSSDEVMGTGEKHLPQFIQLKSTKTSMSMLRSSADSPLRKKLVSFLSQRAKETRSKLLAHLAQHAAAGGPFDKVKKMIKDMIVKLMEEATEESEHKGWCDTEMGTNKQTREDKA